VSTTLVFDADYQETVTLRNGQRVRLRAVRPEDKRNLVRGLHRLSPASRLSRFFAMKKRLTETELRYLTEVDVVNHFAIGALTLRDDDAEGEGIAIGRFVRLDSPPDSAEPAIVVVDAWQGQGLGRMLLERLIDAARERGIRSFHAEFLADNAAIRQLLESLFPRMLMQRKGTVVVATMPIEPEDAAPYEHEPGELLHRLLGLAAQRLLHLKLRR
jgi:GNAT superfamily N-acetyltransferase